MGFQVNNASLLGMASARKLVIPRSWSGLLACMLAGWLLWGCSSNHNSRLMRADNDQPVRRLGGASRSMDFSENKMAMAAPSMAMAKEAPATEGFSASPAAYSSPPTREPNAPAQSQARMVYYSGETTLRSTDPEKVLDSAIEIAKKAGGYLENRSGMSASLRVPVIHFDSLFQQVMRLGEVVSFSQSAQDITEAYQDTDLRLQLVVATLERLEALVQKAKTDAQKLQLLAQLKQLREEREILETSKRALSRKASFASIHLQLQAHTPTIDGGEVKKDIADFMWIHNLNPFDDTRFQSRKTQGFTTPAGMVVSRKHRPWRATASQGAEFWGSKISVEPLGDGRFWSEAVRLRLKEGFKAVDTLIAGGFRFCKFQSFGPSPYYYWVGVLPEGHDLNIVELYFPTEAQQTEHLAAILAAVEKGPVAWYSLF